MDMQQQVLEAIKTQTQLTYHQMIITVNAQRDRSQLDHVVKRLLVEKKIACFPDGTYRLPGQWVEDSKQGRKPKSPQRKPRGPKVCIECEVEKPSGEFYTHRSTCKSCTAEARRVAKIPKAMLPRIEEMLAWFEEQKKKLAISP